MKFLVLGLKIRGRHLTLETCHVYDEQLFAAEIFKSKDNDVTDERFPPPITTRTYFIFLTTGQDRDDDDEGTATATTTHSSKDE